MSDYRAVFFDLDGTLLDVDMNVFLGKYFRMASARLAHLIPPERFVPSLMQATNVMVENDGRAFNDEVFWEAFTPLVGRERAELEPVFEAFYTEDFPQFQALTRPNDDAAPAPSRPRSTGGWRRWSSLIPSSRRLPSINGWPGRGWPISRFAG